jgi:chemotaxis family two-component system response regulator Rcp1
MDGKLGPARIAVVEDNEPDVILIREALITAAIDFEITRFKDGAVALAGFQRMGNQQLELDLIFLDLNIPRLPGLELLTIIRNNPASAHVPVVILTSSQSPEDRTQALKLGATRYVSKPLQLMEFLSVIGAVAKELLSRTH